MKPRHLFSYDPANTPLRALGMDNSCFHRTLRNGVYLQARCPGSCVALSAQGLREICFGLFHCMSMCLLQGLYIHLQLHWPENTKNGTRKRKYDPCKAILGPQNEVKTILSEILLWGSTCAKGVDSTLTGVRQCVPAVLLEDLGFTGLLGASWTGVVCTGFRV